MARSTISRRRLTDLQHAGAGVFVTINGTDGAGRKAANIVPVRAVFVDLDGAPFEPVLACPPPPHIAVESSPGRYHAYWLVRDLPLERFAPLQKAIAARFGGDPAIHDLPRVMRLPGFWHLKGEPFATRTLEQPPSELYPAEQVLAGFAPTDAKPAGSSTPYDDYEETRRADPRRS